MRQIMLVAILLAAAMLTPSRASAQGVQCASMLPRPVTTGKVQARPIAARDLVQLRDIGPIGASFEGASPLALSPDGRYIAFQIRRAHPDTNTYCVGLVILRTDSGEAPRLLDSGGDLTRISFPLRGLEGFPSGLPTPVVPRWSPSGSSLAFLRSQNGISQVWIVSLAGGPAKQLTHGTIAIEDFAWSNDGKEIVFKINEGVARARAEIAIEGRSGFHFDARFAPLSSRTPYPLKSAMYGGRRTRVPGVFSDAAAFDTVAVANSSIRPATTDETAQLMNGSTAAVPGASLFAASSSGTLAWTAPIDPTTFLSPQILRVTRPGKAEVVCQDSACRDHFVGIWLRADGQDVWFLRREGWGLSELGLYRWSMKAEPPKRILRTNSALGGCVAVSTDLICLEEEATVPRRVVKVDLERGTMKVLFTPNPEFASIRMNPVQRLRWRNTYGIETFSDLVLPSNDRKAGPLPLVIVQYDSRGFLRGGTGDEYPIQLLASRGFAVLSFERPRDYALTIPTKSVAEFERVDLEGWADRKSVLASLTEAIDLLTKRGVIDPRRVAITGLSDGGSTVQYGLVNTTRFAAAILSTCCQDPKKLELLGDLSAGYFEQIGYPPRATTGDMFWRSFSLAMNASHIRAPVLMQLADDEYLGALDSYYALRGTGTPVDMFIYPDEHHVKWQPLHRCVIYRRNVAWLQTVLEGGPSTDLSAIKSCD